MSQTAQEGKCIDSSAPFSEIRKKEVTNKRYRTKVALTLLTAYSSLM